MKILIFGDVVAKIGRRAVAQILPRWREEYHPDFVMINAENLAHGVGATDKTVAEMEAAGVDFFTSGNHIWRKQETLTKLYDPQTNIIRPANYPAGTPGMGWQKVEVNGRTILIINLLGQAFFSEALDNPFLTLDDILNDQGKTADVILVDMHAEVTSEKVVMGWHVDGRVSAIYGTHTHVPTADSQILPNGTGYITDVGMTGLYKSSLGANLEVMRQKFLNPESKGNRWDLPETGAAIINAVLIEINPETKKAIDIKQLQEKIEVV